MDCKIWWTNTTFLLVMARVAMGAGLSNLGPSDASLKHYQDKSEAVVVGVVTDGMQKIGVDFSNGKGLRVVQFQLKVSESIKGQIKTNQTITVTAYRVIDYDPWIPEPGQRFVLFLKSKGADWETADNGFGMIFYTPAFMDKLRQVNYISAGPEITAMFGKPRHGFRLRICR